MELPEGALCTILSPVISGKKGYIKISIETIKEGYVRIVGGEIVYLEEVNQLERNKKHSIDVVVDMIVKGNASFS